MGGRRALGWSALGLMVALGFSAPEVAFSAPPNPPLILGPNERLITILGTNDIHGGVEATTLKDGTSVGGMAHWSGVASSIRQGLKSRFGVRRSGVLVVDAGDQFQGTLISNFNEGMLVFSAMNELKYDAVNTGNHDYDFGPVGWLDDQVTPTTDQNPRGALLRAAAAANFPLVSVNTFYRDSLVDVSGTPVAVSESGCRQTSHEQALIDWSRARRPEFLKPYVIKKTAGVRVALVGIDNADTPSVTTASNVRDLCFDDEVSAYTRAFKELESKADVYVVVMHNGDTNVEYTASDFVRKLPSGVRADAVIAGHTHYINNYRANGVPVVQSGSGGFKFGRVDLIYNRKTKTVLKDRTRSFGGVDMNHARCAPSANDFCQVSANGKVAYEGVPVAVNARILELVAKARTDVAGVAERKLGTASAEVRVNRTSESPLANALTDALRGLAKTDISFINAGGIRAPIQKGDFTYEQFYKVLPFNNHGLVIGPMAAENVVALIKRSIQTCGAFGALMQSGLKVRFERDCSRSTNELDPSARLVRAETLSGEIVYDADQGGLVAPAGRTFSVATLDFLAAGGSGFDGFKGTPTLSDMGIAREAMTEYYLQHPASLIAEVDGRWLEIKPTP